MILTGERVDAATALRIGLVEEVVDQGAARERFADPFDGADQREGVNPFLEKLAPQWGVTRQV